MKKLHQRVTQITVLPAGEPIFSRQATVISIEDEAAGEYVTVKNHHDCEGEPHSIDFDPASWPEIRDGIERMMDEISEWEEIITDTKQ